MTVVLRKDGVHGRTKGLEGVGNEQAEKIVHSVRWTTLSNGSIHREGGHCRIRESPTRQTEGTETKNGSSMFASGTGLVGCVHKPPPP